MNNGTHNQTQFFVMQASRETRADLADHFESNERGREDFVDEKAVSEACSPVVASVERRGASKTGRAIAAAWSDAMRTMLSDDEFYEVFSEIRLP